MIVAFVSSRTPEMITLIESVEWIWAP